MATIRKKSTKLSVSLSNDKYQRLLEESKEKSVSMSRLIDDALAGRRLLREDEREMIVELRGELSRIGSNLNQIAHKLNVNNELVTLSQIEATAAEVKSLVSLIKPSLR
jgi:light-regulated signal transduction histidine kinase (bacteriophytochrome)